MEHRYEHDASRIIAGSELLIFDADDTLWESSLYFRRAEEDFIALMESLGCDPDKTREEIQRKDVERLSITGYGARPYINTLTCIMKDRFSSPSPYMTESLDYISRSLLHHPLVLLPHVLHTLNTLNKMGKSMLVYTMGEEDHQRDKFSRSGIAEFFSGITVVPVKNEASMKRLLAKHRVEPSLACMIGNSPRSDINPALRCGVNAIHLLRNNTWEAELEDFIHPHSVSSVSSLGELIPCTASKSG